MRIKFLGELLISFLLIVLLVFFINPFNLLMSSSMHSLMIPTLIIVFIPFAGFLWKETPGDEREQMHKFIASRFAYFAGVTVLLLGIIYQSIHHTLDSWLVITICIILLAKILGLIYGYFRN